MSSVLAEYQDFLDSGASAPVSVEIAKDQEWHYQLGAKDCHEGYSEIYEGVATLVAEVRRQESIAKSLDVVGPRNGIRQFLAINQMEFWYYAGYVDYYLSFGDELKAE